MSVVEAKIQTVEDIYRLVRLAITTRRSIAALYGGRPRLYCPHRLGKNSTGQVRVLCYQYGGESGTGLKPIGSEDNWRCIVLEKLRAVRLLEEDAWCTAPNHSRPQTCVTDVDVDVEDYSG